MHGDGFGFMTLDTVELRKEYEDPHHLLVASDGVNLFLRKWESKTEKPRKAAMLILHGITAYSGPYSMIAEPLSERGFTVYGLDLRGHGLSDGNRGDSPSKERFVNDPLSSNPSQAFNDLIYVMETAVNMDMLSEDLVRSVFMELWPLRNKLDGSSLSKLADIQKRLKTLIQETGPRSKKE